MTSTLEHMWLPSSALSCYEGNATLRSWLLEPGLLTGRMRAACGARFRIEIVGETTEHDEHVREIALCNKDVPWIFAETRVPRSTAQRHPWLLELGENGLGESLQARGGSRRTELEFGRLAPETPLIKRAVRYARVSPQALWVRRSRFLLDDESLLVHEVFLPSVGRENPV